MLTFHKYHGTGNDFVLFDNREGLIPEDAHEWFAFLCHRRFGIGADGVILLNQQEGYDFGMYYVNSDGYPTSMCGNGGRCIVAFAAQLGIIQTSASFLAIDGRHEATLTDRGVKLKMGEPTGFESLPGEDHWIDTGSPHYVKFHRSGNPADLDVVQRGRAIRNSEPWAEQGTNVNFAWPQANGHLYVRTYERGVEDETWSCGTGVTAVAEVYSRIENYPSDEVRLDTPGGSLTVHVTKGQAPWLEGSATHVFSGQIPGPGEENSIPVTNHPQSI